MQIKNHLHKIKKPWRLKIMPFFRCGGTPFASLVKDELSSYIKKVLGNSFNISSTVHICGSENGFGVSNSTAIYYYLSSNNVGALRTLFERFYYTVSTHATSSGYPDVNIIALASGDPESPQYPGSHSGTRYATYFSAVFNKDSAFIESLPKYERLLTTNFISLAGNNVSITDSIFTKFDGGDNERRYEIQNSGSGREQLKNLLINCGYSNVTWNGSSWNTLAYPVTSTNATVTRSLLSGS